MTCGIYQWVNLFNSKRYIGSGTDIGGRRRAHLSALRLNRHYNDHFQRAWNEYGEDQFSFEVLRECDPDDLILWEQIYIDCYDPKDLYNLNLEVNRPASLSADARKKISHAMSTRTISEETRRRMSESKKGSAPPNKGKKASDETRRKISEAKRNMSDETRRRMSEVQKGKAHTDETRRKMSEAHKGKVFTEQARRNISEAAKGRPPVTDETRRKLSEARKTRVTTDETRRRMSEARKRKSTT